MQTLKLLVGLELWEGANRLPWPVSTCFGDSVVSSQEGGSPLEEAMCPVHARLPVSEIPVAVPVYSAGRLRGLRG